MLKFFEDKGFGNVNIDQHLVVKIMTQASCFDKAFIILCQVL